jgi:uncharacterized repeat protein (TIGR01451 family)
MLCASAAALFGQQYVISTVAGGVIPTTPGVAVNTSVGQPLFAVADASGNVYFSSDLNCVFELSPGGTVTRVAGTCGVGAYSGDGGPATSAQLSNPRGLAFDSSGNLYIADSGNGRVRMVSTTGTITTVAGNGNCCTLGDGGPAVDAWLNSPADVAVDTSGNLYIADSGNRRIRKVGTSGIITTVAGTGVYGYSGDGQAATGAQLASPQGVAMDGLGDLFIGDTNNNRVREVSVGGIITTVAGSGSCCNPGDGGPATAAWLNNPVHVIVDGQGNLYIADQYNQRIRKVSSGTITTVAGSGNYGYAGDGGQATSASLAYPWGMALNSAGDLYIADHYNWRVREVSTSGIINTVAGNGSENFSGDGGPAIAGGLASPLGVAVDASGNFYVADTQNNRIRKISSSGTITTVAGNGIQGFWGDGGLATNAQLNAPGGVLVDSIGNLYIADTNNCRVREVSTSGIITTVAGNGGCGESGDGGSSTSAQLAWPRGLALDAAGNLYVSDQGGHSTVRKVSTQGVISTVAGNGTSGYSGDGGLATSAELNYPTGLAMDASGNLYIADSNNHRIREVSAASGNISTVAGDGNCCFGGDGGAATSAYLNYPQGIAVDTAGNLYIADTNEQRIRKVSTTGIISTIAGTGNYGYSGDDGAATSALFAGPEDLAVSSSGDVYVADGYNNAIRLLQPVAVLPVLSITKTHTSITQGQSGATYTITVSNAASAGPTVDTVTVTDIPPAALTLVSMSGTGWTCSVSSCERSDALSPGSSYPAITVTVNVAASAPYQVTNQASVSGGGSVPASVSDVANAVGPPAVPDLVFPENGATGTSLTPGLSWEDATGATSYDVHFGTASTPPLALNTTATLYQPAGLAANTTYYWYVVAKDGSGTSSSAIWSFTTGASATLPVPPYIITTVAGGAPPPTPMAATTASVGWTNGVTTDAAGNLYFSSTLLGSVFKVDASGTLTRVAGTGRMGYSGDGGPATSAQLNRPGGLAFDSQGNLYIADASNNRIRRVSTTGIITTVAGSGSCCNLGDGGPATSAWISNPQDVTVDAQGNLYFPDSSNRIRKVSTTGVISTIAGNGNGGFSGDGGPATSAQLNSPRSVALDAAGNLYFSDFWNYRVRMVSTSGTITTVAGNGTQGSSGDGGLATSAEVNGVQGVAVDAAGNLYLAEWWNLVVRKVSAGIITTVAGGGPCCSSTGDGGPATSAWLDYPQGITLDAAGNLYIADQYHYSIRKVSTSQTITTVAGNGSYGYSGDGGPATSAQLGQPQDVALDSAGNLYIADMANNLVRKVAAGGTISTVAGTGVQGYSGDGGAATAAQLCNPYGVAVDSAGNLYIADSCNNRIREVSTTGTITTVAGNGNCCYSGDGGLATSAQMNYPQAVAVDASGNLYIAGTNDNRIRKVSTAGIITTVAGNGTNGFSGDGGLAISAQLAGPNGVAVDSTGNIYVADQGNNRVRRIDSSGTITTVAGNGQCCFGGDGGPAVNANVWGLGGVAVDAAGDIYLSVNSGATIRRVSTGGIIQTIGSNTSYGYSGDGGPATSAQLANPRGMAIDSQGRIYVADADENAVRLLQPVAALPALSITKTHTSIVQGQTGATYTITVSNAASAGPTIGTVTVTDTPPAVLTLVSMIGTGWTCSGSSCARSDALSPGSSYPSITVTVNVAASTPYQVTNQASVSGGASAPASVSDVATAVGPPAAPVLIYPENGATGTTLTPGLSWSDATGVTSYDVYFGTSSTPPFALNTTATLYQPATLAANTVYYWYVVAKDAAGGSSSAIWSFTTGAGGTPAVPPFIITTVAGGVPPPTPVPATTASVGWTYGVATDAAGNLYFSSGLFASVFKVDASGTLTRVAGTGRLGYSGDGGPATSAQLSYPEGLAFDSQGNLYIADSSNGRIRQVSTGGIITTVAGGGPCCNLGDGGPATSAQLSYPQDVKVDAQGNLYIVDSSNSRIRKVSTTGVISTVAGNGNWGFSGDGGSATAAQLNYPTSVALDAAGNIYIADSNNYRVRMVSINGVITTVAGTGSQGYSGDGGPATSAQLSYAYGLAVDAAGNLYISDSGNGRVRKVSGGTITTVAGGGPCCSSTGDGGPATSAFLDGPEGIVFDMAGNLYIADSGHYSIRKVSTSQIITTVAGNGSAGYSGDGGLATSAQLGYPEDAAVDSTGNFYIADYYNSRIRKISTAGIITTVAGDGSYGYSGDGGLATNASLNYPQGVAVDSAGNLYIADVYNNRIRKVSTAGIITTVAGGGNAFGSAGDGGLATNASLFYPQGVAVDSAGNLYIAETYDNRIRKVSTAGIITTVAGNGNYGNSGDGGLAVDAGLYYPSSVAVDSAGSLYVVSGNYPGSVRRIDSSGIITTVAGGGPCCNSGNGIPAIDAWLNSAQGVAVDAAGNLYISTEGAILEVSTDGTINTIAGTGAYGYMGDGGLATSAQLANPMGMALDAQGRIYVADSSGGAIRLLQPANGPLIPGVSGSGLNTTSVAAGGLQFDLTVSGTNFVSGAVVMWNGTALSTTFVSATEVIALVPASLIASAGTASVTVVNPDGATSAAVTFTINPAGLAISGLSPVSAVPGGAAFTLTVNGTAFISGAVVDWNGTALATTFVGATQLTASVPAALIASAGMATVTVVNPGAVTSGGVGFPIQSGPQATSVSPGAGIGANQTFTFTFSDPSGYQNLQVVNVLMNNYLDGIQACYVAYSKYYGMLLLVDDGGDSAGPYAGYLTVPSAGSITGSMSNSQCTVNGAGSSVVGSGNTLTLTLNISFSSSFAGNRIVYTAAGDTTGNSGWQALSTWQVPGAAGLESAMPIQPTGVTPASGSGASQSFVFTFTDNAGWQDLGLVDVLFNNYLDGIQACYVAYSKYYGMLLLVDDGGDSAGPYAGYLALPGTGSMSNSQCTVNGAGSSVVGSGNTLTLTLNISFSSSFAGNRIFYTAAGNVAGTENSGWNALGAWTVP